MYLVVGGIGAGGGLRRQSRGERGARRRRAWVGATGGADRSVSRGLSLSLSPGAAVGAGDGPVPRLDAGEIRVVGRAWSAAEDRLQGECLHVGAAAPGAAAGPPLVAGSRVGGSLDHLREREQGVGGAGWARGQGR